MNTDTKDQGKSMEKLNELLASASPQDIAKAVRETLGLAGIRDIKDLWADGESFHKVPGRDEIKTGPHMESSGSGADKAIKEYSDPSPQISITEEYQKFNSVIAGFSDTLGAATKSIDSLPGKVSESISTALGGLLSSIEESKKSSTKTVVAKDPDPKPEPDEMKAGDENEDVKIEVEEEEEEDEPEHKAWTDLAQLETIIGNMESAKGNKDIDLGQIRKAKVLVDQIVKSLESLTDNSDKSQRKTIITKASKLVSKAWDTLGKSALERYGLHGTGNQAAEAEKGPRDDEEAEMAEAKAKFYATKANRLKKSSTKTVVAKDPDPDPDPEMHCAEEDKKPFEDEKETEEMKSSIEHFYNAGLGRHPIVDVNVYGKVKKSLGLYSKSLSKSLDLDSDVTKDQPKVMDVDPTPKSESDSESLKEFKKATAERIASLEARINTDKRPSMVPIVLKSKGISNDSVLTKTHNAISVAVDNGELTEADASLASSLVDRYRAASQGHMDISKVNQQLSQASDNVQAFFENTFSTQLAI